MAYALPHGGDPDEFNDDGPGPVLLPAVLNGGGGPPLSPAVVAATAAEFLLPDRCRARSKSTGAQCSKPPIPGGTVCRYHGGAAPQVRERALERLREARDLALERLIENLAPGSSVDPAVQLSIVDKLTAKIELLEGRATERRESSEHRVVETRHRIEAALAAISARIESGGALRPGDPAGVPAPVRLVPAVSDDDDGDGGGVGVLL